MTHASRRNVLRSVCLFTSWLALASGAGLSPTVMADSWPADRHRVELPVRGGAAVVDTRSLAVIVLTEVSDVLGGKRWS
ncbi:hypothetical protein ACFYN3_40330 [Streptomyces lavendulae]|uniref:hypothetical protein n=1 Tax=Streptomyces lavendulae TaxID=1914 RepID=UPI0036BD405A